MDQLANTVAENLPSVIEFGKAYLFVSLIVTAVVVATIVGGAVYGWKVYSRAEKKNCERIEEVKRRYGKTDI